jgi:signal transduction histidine kinase
MDLMSINDLFLECIRASVLIALLAILFLRGKLTSLAGHPGWKQILIGFTLITLATLLDITDEIPGLEKYIIIGDTIMEAFLEKLPGYLLGFVLVLVGFYKMIPSLLKAQEAEEELEKYKDNLELLVIERTQELEETQAELLQKERLATLGQLTATVSHELRNPLGTIQSALFSIEESLEDKEPQRANRPLELADRSINRCVRIIEELTNYARVKDLRLSERPVDDWLKSLVDANKMPEGISVELDLRSGVQAQFDEDKLQQVIINLIDNAIHALEPNPPKDKSLRILSKPLNGMYEIQIIDNGIGIASEIKDKIFEPLFSTKDFGIGLGMVIVENLIKQHHGTIQVDSNEGEGTTVTLCLPLAINGGTRNS